jgi:hypothetical protein
MARNLGVPFRPTAGEHFYLQLLQAIARWPAHWAHRLPTGERLIYAGPGEIKGMHRIRLITTDEPPIIAESQYSGTVFSDDTPEDVEGIILRDLRVEAGQIKLEQLRRGSPKSS